MSSLSSSPAPSLPPRQAASSELGDREGELDGLRDREAELEEREELESELEDREGRGSERESKSERGQVPGPAMRCSLDLDLDLDLELELELDENWVCMPHHCTPRRPRGLSEPRRIALGCRLVGQAPEPAPEEPRVVHACAQVGC